MFSDVLITVDFDRTLTAPDSTIPQRNIEAIRYFMENGGAFTVNTGRSIPMAAQAIIPDVPANAPLLLYNGSAAYDRETRELSLLHPIELDPDAVILDMVERFPALYMVIEAPDAHYLTRKNPGWEAFNKRNHCTWGYSLPSRIPGPFLKFSVYGEFRDDTVASMYEATPEEMELFRQAENYLRETYGDKLEVYRSCARIMDIHAKGVSKATAAMGLKEKLGRKILVCVGDAENDVLMLNAADYAFIPGDSMLLGRYESVCSCGEGAVADVIYKKIPEILGMNP